jgi:SAM-dependent methyltransferase
MQDVLKTRAIELHTEQAGEFVARYQQLHEDPYRSTFTYGRKKIEELLERELRALPARARVLDAGCGTGFNVQRLRGRGLDVVGLEPSRGMRAAAIAANPGVQILDGDIEQIPLPDASFDAVISIEVIRYLKDPAHGLAEIARVVRPGGLAFVTAAPLFSLNGYALINQVTARVHVPTFTHVKHSFLTARSARRAALSAGFSSADVHGLFLGPFHALGRLSPSILAAVLRWYEPIDNQLADRPVLRDLSNHLVIVARR